MKEAEPVLDQRQGIYVMTLEIALSEKKREKSNNPLVAIPTTKDEGGDVEKVYIEKAMYSQITSGFATGTHSELRADGLKKLAFAIVDQSVPQMTPPYNSKIQGILSELDKMIEKTEAMIDKKGEKYVPEVPVDLLMQSQNLEGVRNPKSADERLAKAALDGVDKACSLNQPVRVTVDRDRVKYDIGDSIETEETIQAQPNKVSPSTPMQEDYNWGEDEGRSREVYPKTDLFGHSS